MPETTTLHTPSREELDAMIARLVAVGDDEEELTFWSSIYEDLEPEEQHALATLLSNELHDIQTTLAAASPPSNPPLTSHA